MSATIRGFSPSSSHLSAQTTKGMGDEKQPRLRPFVCCLSLSATLLIGIDIDDIYTDVLMYCRIVVAAVASHSDKFITISPSSRLISAIPITKTAHNNFDWTKSPAVIKEILNPTQ
jgi:hypothetical protein